MSKKKLENIHELPETITSKLPDYMPTPLITQGVGSTYLNAIWSYRNHLLQLELKAGGACTWTYDNRQNKRHEEAHLGPKMDQYNFHVGYMFEYFNPQPDTDAHGNHIYR